MKKEELLEGLKAEIGNPDAEGNYGETGLSQRSVESYVENVMLPSVGAAEKVEDGYYKSQAEFLKSIGGQLRHEKAEFAKNYKPSPEPGKRTDGANDDMKALLEKIEKLSESNKKLEEKFAAGESMRKKAELLKKVESAMKGKGASNAYVLKNVLKGAEIDAEKSVDEITEALLKQYDAELAEASGDGAVPRNGGGGGKGGSAADGYFKRKAKREGWGHTDGNKKV